MASCCNTTIANTQSDGSPSGGSSTLGTLYVDNIFAVNGNPTALINGVNPATTAAFVNQDVRTIASPNFQGLDITTAAGQGITLDCTNNAVTNNEVVFAKSGVYGGSVGLNLATDETYLWSQNSLKIGTNATERLRIPTSGIATDNTAANVLALQGTTLVSRNDLADLSSFQTFQNKTIDSALNTIDVNGSNIISLINQDVTTLGSPTFNQVTTTASFEPFVIRAVTPANPCGLTIYEDNVFTSAIGVNTGANRMYVYTEAPGRYIGFFTNGAERLRIESGGITNNNAVTNVLAIDGGNSLVYKNDLVDTSSAQTLTGKTIDSAANTLEVNGTNINSLIDQDVRTTASPTFAAVTTTNEITIGSYRFSDSADQSFFDIINSGGSPFVYRYVVRQTIAAGAVNTVLWSYSYAPDHSLTVDFMGTGFNAANNGSGSYHYTNNFRQISGVITNNGTLYTDKKESGAPYGGKLSLTFGISGSNMRMYASNSAAFAISLSGVINQFLTR